MRPGFLESDGGSPAALPPPLVALGGGGLTPEQIEMRKTGVGASEIAAVAGLNKYCSPHQVWLEKTGRAPPFEGNDATALGAYLEPWIAARYAKATGSELRRSTTLRHPEMPWALATPDRLVMGEAGPVKVLEIKTALGRSVFSWGKEGNTVPAGYQAQAQWLMHVTGIRSLDVAALVGPEFKIFPVEYDAEMVGMLVKVASNFWFNHVLADVPPKE